MSPSSRDADSRDSNAGPRDPHSCETFPLRIAHYLSRYIVVETLLLFVAFVRLNSLNVCNMPETSFHVTMPKTLLSRLSKHLNGVKVLSAKYVGYDAFEIRTAERIVRMETRTLRLYEHPSRAFLGYLSPEIRVYRGFSLKALNDKFNSVWTIRMLNERTVEFICERARVVVEEPWNTAFKDAFSFAVRRVLTGLRLIKASRGVNAVPKESNTRYLKNYSDDIYRFDETTGLWSLFTGDNSSLKRIERAKRPFDTHDELKHMFVMRNVALDTRTGEFVTLKPEHRCTRSTAYSYDPVLSAEYKSEMLRAFSRLFPVDEDREAFWRFMASVVRGDRSPVLTATGDGKDDLLCIVAYVLDIYACRILFDDSFSPVFRLVSRFTTNLRECDAKAHVYPKYNLDYEPWASAIIDQIRSYL